MGGDGGKEAAAGRFGVPVDLLDDAENFRHADQGVYHDNMATVETFCDMLTQWRMGPTGPTGLDYQALPVVFRIRRIPRADHGDIFSGVQVMERAALKRILERNRDKS